MLNDLEDLKRKLTGARKALDEIKTHDHQLREALAAAERERASILSACEPLADVVATMRRMIKSKSDEWRSLNGAGIATEYSAILRAHDLKEDRSTRVQSPNGYDPRDLTFDVLCGLLPDLISEQLEAIIQASGVHTGAGISDRETLLRAVDERIAAIESAHTELVNVAGACDPPIVIRLLPRVDQRLEIERRRREIDDQHGGRNHLAAAVNRIQTRTGESDYMSKAFVDKRDVGV
jgi:hypothetical protein